MCTNSSEKGTITVVTAQMRSSLCQGQKSQRTQGGNHQHLISNFQLVRVMAKSRGQNMKDIPAISQKQKKMEIKK